MHPRTLVRLLCYCLSFARTAAGELNLPPRQPDALDGTRLSERLSTLSRVDREREIIREIAHGNVPDAWRHFVRVKVTRNIDGETFVAEIDVAPDYLALGSDKDFLWTPLSPRSAQVIADQLDCVLPTRQMVDDIYRAAFTKLMPSPIPPGPRMVNVDAWIQHRDIVRKQLAEVSQSPGLVAGHKKDVVVSSRLETAPGKVAIYGWHRLDGTPIQPLYLGHTETWVDYSHGVRLVRRSMRMNGKPTTVDQVLADPKLSILLSDDGVIQTARYPKPLDEVASIASEKTETLSFEPGVRVVLNSPVSDDGSKPVKLILFALPSGNSIEQTIGRHTNPGDDWHFDIQHIGAQTRWLRERLTDSALVVAYLECEGKSWPNWRRKHDPKDERIVQIVEALRLRFAKRKVALVLTGHSGGGSFTFGFLNGVDQIPDDVERIAFLDSNYAYDSAKAHGEKLAAWLTSAQQHYLNVIAYEDHIALLDGKTFVSENGGTWGRSHAMLADLSGKFPFQSGAGPEWERQAALEGRVKFLMRKNPGKAVLHTRLVEFNGFIHAMLSGTEYENEGYTFFGPRAYEALISRQ